MADKLVRDWLEAFPLFNREMLEDEVLTELCGSLDLGTMTFPEFIRALTSRVEQEVDLTVAGQVLSLLPRALAGMQIEASRNDVSALIPYLCARLGDASPGVAYIARALQILSTWKRFPPGDAQQIARAVFKLGASNNFATQTGPTRLSLYQLIDTLSEIHPNTLQRDMTVKEFIGGVVTMAELEKNPSCLRALFYLYASLSREWPLEESELKLVFDSYIRYFPVTMKEAPKDSLIPSTAELRDLLLECFISNDGYASMTFEAMVDRLDVDSANTKAEVFRTLERCVKSYSVPAVVASANKLWDTLKFEVWNGSNKDWIDSSLNLLREVAASLDRVPSDWLANDGALYNFVAVALRECKNRITDKPATYLPTCGRIFNAIASSSYFGLYLVVKFAVPILETCHQGYTTAAEMIITLEALNGILEARLQQADVKPLSQEEFAAKSAELQEYQLTSESHMTNAFDVFRDKIVEIYHGDVLQVQQEKIEDLSFGVPAIKGLLMIFSIPTYLSDPTKGVMVNELIDIALNENQKEEIRGAAEFALSRISSSEPLLFQDVMLDAIFQKLPTTLSQDREEKVVEIALVVSLLEALVRIGATTPSVSQHSNFVTMQMKLVQRLVDTLSHPGQLEYQHAILASFIAWFAATSENPASMNGGNDRPILAGKSFDAILLLLEHIVVVKSVGGNQHVKVVNSVDDNFVRLVGEYIMIVLRTEPTSRPNFLVEWDRDHFQSSSAIWNLFTAVDSVDFTRNQLDLSKSSRGQCYAVALSMHIVAGLRREDMKLLNFDVASTSKAMLLNSIDINKNHSNFTKSSIHYFLQVLVNKFGAAKLRIGDGEETLVGIMERLVGEAVANNSANALNTFHTLAYFAGASLGALDPSTAPLIKLMLDNLPNPALGRKVAQSFRLLLVPSAFLTKENFCFTRPLRMGRVYELAVKPLIRTWRRSQDPTIKENALIAVVGIIAFLEPGMLAENARDILPVLLEGTNISDDKFFSKEACTRGILNIIPFAESIVEEHLNSIISRMTDRIENTNDCPSDSNINCRCLALEVLFKLTDHVKKPLLMKKKPALLRELDFAVADLSPAVRHKAERCRMRWGHMVEGELA